MSLSRSKALLLSLAIAFAVTAVLAVPVIQVTVQQVGAGYSDVLAPCSKAYVNHVFKIENCRIKLDAVKVKFDKDLLKGTTIKVELRELRDSGDHTLTCGSIELAEDLPAGTWITVDLEPDLGIYDLLKYDRIVVVVVGPEVPT